MPDSHKNFSYSTVATAPSPADTGTSLVVQAGGGVLFPTVPFNATVWPAGVQPLASNAEIVRVTNISTDTFTITRQQEGSSARSILVGDQIAATITTKTLTDAEGGATFLDLTDTPASYSGQAHKGVKVNAGATGLEFVQTWPGLRHTFDEGVTAGKTIRSDALNTGFATAPTIAASGGTWAGFAASPVVSGAVGFLQGLNFIVRCQRQDGGAVSYLEGCRAGWGIVDAYCTIANANGFVVPTPNHGSFGLHTIATSRGVHVQNVGNSNLIAKAVSFQADDHTTAVIGYLMEMGPSTPYLRLLGKAAPGAGLTNLYLNEGGTLRRVQQKAFSTLQAADRVMVLV